MKENAIKNAWNKNNFVVNGWAAMANTFSAEVLATSG